MSRTDFELAIPPLLAELEASADAQDTDRHMALYAKDASLTFVFNGRLIRGWDELAELQRQWWSPDKPKATYRYQREPVLEVLGSEAGLTTFLIAARRVDTDGTASERTLAYSALWRRTSKGWRIAFAHESSDK